MKIHYSSFLKTRVNQQGVAVVEFALVVIPLLLLLLGAMEFGRLMFVWNTVQEVTRNAARQAVVTDFTSTSEIAAIKHSALFSSGSLPAYTDIKNASVNIRYLNSSGAVASPIPTSPSDNIAACLDATRIAECIRFVEVCISTGDTCDRNQSMPFIPMIALFSKSGDYSTDLTGVKIPLSTVRMPAESLGFSP